MAWQTPHHSCGHDGERYQAYGPHRGREVRLAAEARQQCPDCRKQAADEAAQAAGLPLLTGSAKQVAWASEIRERAIRLLSADRVATMQSETSARWWIDHRTELGS